LIAKLQSRAGEGVFADFSQKEALVVGLGDTLDLHTFQPKELPSLLDEFIRVSQKEGLLLVKIVHGKGTGALRRRVRGLLAHDPRVANFYNAQPKSGGWGATVVELKARQEGEDDKVRSNKQKWLTN
jgi:DNA-nicking Smr family endonuclease